jgi:peptidoglycan/LPS O-acetylase OafA/YrhL
MSKETINAREVNNFDVLRIVFAWFVVISHSYFLNGASISDPLGWATNNYLIFSYIGVKGFFVISGYLIFQSLIRSRSLMEYLTKRALRIFPGLVVAVFLTLVATYFVYPKKDIPYFLDPAIYSYFRDNILLFISHFDIPGVFENMKSTALNGSLWTIKFEFL